MISKFTIVDFAIWKLLSDFDNLGGPTLSEEHPD
jgi:hypothetical protein